MGGGVCGGTECPDGAPPAGLAALWPWSRVALFLSWPSLSLSSPVVPPAQSWLWLFPLGFFQESHLLLLWPWLVVAECPSAACPLSTAVPGVAEAWAQRPA